MARGGSLIVLLTAGLLLAGAGPALAFDPAWTPGFADRVLVKKSDRKLYVYQDGALLATYSVALGRNPVGRKLQAGDARTPEGRYILDWRKANSEFHRAIHVSYPNADDMRSARKRGVSTGGDIMVHGLPNWYHGDDRYFSFGDWTNGCIALVNRDMDALWEIVPEGTPIDILP